MYYLFRLLLNCIIQYSSVCPTVAVPCGHSFCAECITLWMRTPSQRRRPTCPTCRKNLDVLAPIVPNYALEAVVDAHIEALGVYGVQGWSPIAVKPQDTALGGVSKGSELREAWERRKQKWRPVLLRLAALWSPRHDSRIIPGMRSGMRDRIAFESP
ncbi:hypothetical protein BS47DRAFT_998625 [Hydnum rufescens UP504]|uniref:RING-type domain-containing protein n=1 Tax=Hydnum rufescens UP504 TaxID=1448309 RepID=A0A9P6B9M2_9AGAM|nr:hypothetical protein BS47DRAFT_998625 [Hydnum rufescens UP504]